MTPAAEEVRSVRKRLQRLGNLARAQAARADPDALVLVLDLGPYALQVGLPHPLGHVVGMADVRADHADFTTNLAMSSQLSSLAVLDSDRG